MEIKHTPGNWSIHKTSGTEEHVKEYGHGYDVWVVGDGRFLKTPIASVNCPKNLSIQNVFDMESKQQEVEANAKLIAAAPDLLEACMILLEDNGYDISLPIEGFSHRTQQVINAIKKAVE